MRLPISPAFLAVLCASSSAHHISPGSVAGSYDLRLCRGSCSVDSAVYQRGVLVLSDTSWPRVQPLGFFDSLPANGCFRLKAAPGRGDSYAGIIGSAAVRWQPIAGTDSVTFLLYQSPDAGYEVTLTRFPQGLRGRGTSWGAGVVEIHAPVDTVLAIRTGPPIPSKCGRL